MRSLALLMFVAATLPMAFLRPIIGLLLWMMFSYLNPHRITWGFAVSFPWVMLVALVTLVGLAMQARQRQMPPFKPLVVLMSMFLIWVAIGTLQAAEPTAASKELTQFCKMMIMTFATLMLVTDREKLHWVLWVIVASFGFWGFKGGLFTLLTGGNYHVMGPEHSFFTDNNAFALIMCMSLPLMRYVQTQLDQRWLKIGLWVVMGLTAVAIIGTYSRGGLLALAVTGFMLIWKSRRRGALILIAPLLVVGIGAFMPQQYFSRMDTINQYEQDSSAVGRIESWKFATQVAVAHPLFGGGFDVWRSDSMWNQYGPPDAAHRAIHSIFFEVLGEQGFVGLGFFISMLAFGYFGLARIRKQARARTDSEWLADLASMLQVCLVAYAAGGAFLPLPYIDFFYQLLGLIAVMQVLVKQQPVASTETAGKQEQQSSKVRAPRRRQPRVDRPRPAGLSPSSRRIAKPGGVGGAQDLPPW